MLLPALARAKARALYTGTFSDDRTTINGEWEKSFDGVTWSHDFALTYRRIG